MNPPAPAAKLPHARFSFASAAKQIRANPIGVLAGLVLLAVLVYFFGVVRLFGDRINGLWSIAVWCWQVWSPKNNYEHAKLIPLIVLFLVWYDRDRLKAAPIGSSRWGWLFLGFGIFLFFAAARTLQARLALTSLPFLLFGAVLYVWGKAAARILLFPIAFLFFMVPLNFLTQATLKLQFVETGAATAICNFFGIGVFAIGTTINAVNEAFHFQIDEGCSGIRSLMAIAMLAALYGHFTQDRLWKKLTLFAASLLFAIIGNTGRLVSIIVVARLFGQDLAGGPYHTISGYLSFPFALGAMMLFGKLLNLGPKRRKDPTLPTEGVSYDY